MDAKAALAASMASKKTPTPKPTPKGKAKAKPPQKGSITDQVIKKYGQDYGNVKPGSAKWYKMANDSLFD